MKKILSLVIISIFIMSGTGFSKMRGGGGKDGFKMPHGKWWRLPAVQEKLKVTSDEQKKLDTLYTKSRRTMIDLKASVEKAKLDLEEIMDSETFDKKACLKKFQSLQAAKSKLSTERFSFIIEVRELFGQERYLTLSSQRQEIKRSCARKANRNCPALGGKTSRTMGKSACTGQFNKKMPKK